MSLLHLLFNLVSVELVMLLSIGVVLLPVGCVFALVQEHFRATDEEFSPVYLGLTAIFWLLFAIWNAGLLLNPLALVALQQETF